MTLHVLEPGLLTTVQDLGRPGYQGDGIPEGGAMDPVAHRVANQLVGNSDDAATLEITMTGPSLRFETEALVAFAGADLAVTIDDIPVPGWRPVSVRAGATLRSGALRSGCRAYFATAGGIDVPRVLGSRSTYLRAAIGGMRGRALKRSDVVPTGVPTTLGRAITTMLTRGDRVLCVAPWGAGPSLRPPYADTPTVRMIEGAHTSRLTPRARELLVQTEFRVGVQSDRMGYRLEAAALELSSPVELLSEAVAFGTVQLPPNGKPIILMADRQTTGGYPRIGAVATVDLPLLAQLKPGDRVRFRIISLEEAQSYYLAREHDLVQSAQAIRLISAGAR